MFCAGAVVLTEGLFYNLITVGASDPSTLGVYEKVRKSYGQGRPIHFSFIVFELRYNSKGLVILINAWYLGNVGTQQQRWSRVRMPMHSRAMTV